MMNPFSKVIVINLLLIFIACKNKQVGIGIGTTLQRQFHTSKELDMLNRITTDLSMEDCPMVALSFTLDGQHFIDIIDGLKDQSNHVDSVDMNTSMRIGSISKGFTGVLCAILIDQGFFKMEDAVKKYIPQFGMKANPNHLPITIGHVLNHSTGLTEHAYSNFIEQNHSKHTILDQLYKAEARDSTGKVYAYQNATYGIMEEIIQITTGLTYEQALAKYIFLPVGMKSTTLGFDALINSPNKTLPHRINGKGVYHAFMPDKAYYNIASAGGLNSNLGDMKKYLKTIMNDGDGKISKTALDIAFTSYINSSSDDRYFNFWQNTFQSYYGLGWRILDMHGRKVIFHGGQVNQYRTEIAFDPVRKNGIVAMFNSTCSYTHKVIPSFFNVLDSECVFL
jgi:beta-lactamase class C